MNGEGERGQEGRRDEVEKVVLRKGEEEKGKGRGRKGVRQG